MKALAPVLALAALLAPAMSVAQDAPLLAITSPADGTVVAPGQVLSVTVTSPAGAEIVAVGLSGDAPIGVVDMAEAVPAAFSLELPATLPCGKYTLTAVAATAAGENTSATIEIDVEVADLPGAIFAELPEIVFEGPGQTSPSRQQAIFLGGSVLDVTGSTNAGYSSADPTVATVDAQGVVTAVGPGDTQITARYGPPEANLTAVIPVFVPDPLFTVSARLLDFGTEAVGSTSSAQEITVTNTSGEPLAMAEVTTGDDFAMVETCVGASPLPVDGTCIIHVTFSPTDVGPREGVVQVTSVVSTLGVRVTGVGLAPAVTISSFTPDSGPVGTSVTIEGAGFSSLPAENTLTFNGTLAAVSAASATALVATVPPGATTGPIAVTTPEGSATSATPFTVTGPPVPTISGFTPAAGVVGTVVTITGTHFDPAPAADAVRFNITNGRPTTATASSITVPVPARAGSGRITVTTAAGTAVSRDDFIVPPAPYTPADLAVSGRIPFATPIRVTVPVPGQIALMLFDGTAGQRVSLVGTEGMAGQSDDCDVNVSILRPNNRVLAPATCMEGSGFINTRTLPTTGTYAVLVVPLGAATGSVTLTLHDVPPDVTAGITAGGPAVTVTTTTPGQNAALTFAGTAGQRVSLRGTDGMVGQVSGCDVRARIESPDGTVLAPATCMEGDGFIDVRTLPATGAYTIVVNPVREAVGSLTLTLLDVPADTTGSVAVSGPSVAVALGTPGQNGSLTLDGAASTHMTVRMTGNTFGRVAVRLVAPDGTLLAHATSAAATFKIPPQTLPATGTYTIVVDPSGANTGLVNVSVTSP